MVELKEPANLNEFRELLSKHNKVIVDFTATWCGPCRMVKPIIHKLAEQHTDILFLVVDVDDRAVSISKTKDSVIINTSL